MDNYQDIIDSRDIIERIEELQTQEQDTRDHVASLVKGKTKTRERLADLLNHIREMDGRKFYRLDPEESQELQELESLAQEGEDYAADWMHGEILIRDSYFQDYAEQLADDIGAINKDSGWPSCFIDWDAASEALKQDYTEIDYAGEPYWVRS